jgi:hypothetical protein
MNVEEPLLPLGMSLVELHPYTAMEIGVMVLSPERLPRRWVGVELRAARRLEEKGLMKNLPEAPNLFATTPAGEVVIQQFLTGRVPSP